MPDQQSIHPLYKCKSTIERTENNYGKINFENKPAEAEEPAEILPKEEAQPEQVNEKKPEEIKAEDDKDIKIKQLEAQVNDLQKNLKQVQKENTTKNLQHEKPNEQEMLNNIARAFM